MHNVEPYSVLKFHCNIVAGFYYECIIECNIECECNIVCKFQHINHLNHYKIFSLPISKMHFLNVLQYFDVVFHVKTL